jgi:hypothetical protein
MFRVRILLATVLSLAALAVVAAPANATVRAASSSAFCKPITGIADKLKNNAVGSSKLDVGSFKKIASALRSSGKHAPTKVKKAANAIASYYSALSSGDTSALSNASKIGGATSTYFAYVATHC